MMTENQPRAAIYVRVSSTQQEQEHGALGTQEESCRRHATAHGYQVAEVYREVRSGGSLGERPQFTALREAVRRHELDAVIAYSPDRLARDSAQLDAVVSEADEAEVAVQFVTDAGRSGGVAR